MTPEQLEAFYAYMQGMSEEQPIMGADGNILFPERQTPVDAMEVDGEMVSSATARQIEQERTPLGD